MSFLLIPLRVSTTKGYDLLPRRPVLGAGRSATTFSRWGDVAFAGAFSGFSLVFRIVDFPLVSEEQPLLVAIERERNPVLSGPAGAADPMYIVFGSLWPWHPNFKSSGWARNCSDLP